MASASLIRAWLAPLSVYLERRIIIVLVLGFSAGLPYMLTFVTLSARLREADVSLTVIGFFVLAGLAYSIKYLWAPLVDRAPFPLLSRVFGQRRGWLLAAQAAVAVMMTVLAVADPNVFSLPVVAAAAVALAFSSATQDIVIDAYRIESLDDDRQGAGAAAYIFGYRLAILASTGGVLILAEFYGWVAAIASMSVMMAAGVTATLLAHEPEAAAREGEDNLTDEPWYQAALARVPALGRVTAGLGGYEYGKWIIKAVVGPFMEFMSREKWAVILLFALLYKYGDALLGVMSIPFYLDTGFTKAEVGVITKGYGLIATLTGCFLGGALIRRIGVMRGLLVGGVAQAAANVMFMIQAAVGADLTVLTLTITLDNICGGVATVAFVAYLSALCSVQFTATQYALFSSLFAAGGKMFASGGGWLADQTNWVTYFGVTILAAAPGLLLLWYLMKHAPAPGSDAAGAAAAAAKIPDTA